MIRGGVFVLRGACGTGSTIDVWKANCFRREKWADIRTNHRQEGGLRAKVAVVKSSVWKIVYS